MYCIGQILWMKCLLMDTAILTNRLKQPAANTSPVLLLCWRCEIDATLERLKKLERDLSTKEQELKERERRLKMWERKLIDQPNSPVSPPSSPASTLGRNRFVKQIYNSYIHASSTQTTAVFRFGFTVQPRLTWASHFTSSSFKVCAFFFSFALTKFCVAP